MVQFMSFWSINGPLDEALLCQQLEDFRDLGFDGVIFHPRYYPGEPEYLGVKYMEIVSKVILHAKKIGLLFWIYDEDGARELFHFTNAAKIILKTSFFFAKA